MGWMRRVGFLLGAGLFSWVLLSVDLRAVWNEVSGLQWRFVLIVLFYGVVFLLDTLGWKYALKPSAQAKVRWDRLFRARLAGEALNYVTPTASLGGEPVKAVLLSRRHGVPIADGMASVVIAKTTIALSMLLFAGMGVVITLFTRPLTGPLSMWVWVVLPALSLLLVLFLLAQFFEPFRRLNRMVQGFLPLRAARIGSSLEEWDRAITDFYRRSPAALFTSIGFHFLGWIAGAVEVYLIMHFLGFPIGLATAWSVEGLWVLLRSGAFMIPGSLGASEGFLLLICVGMGISAVSGLAMALIRRAREILWMGLGLIEFGRE